MSVPSCIRAEGWWFALLCGQNLLACQHDELPEQRTSQRYLIDVSEDRRSVLVAPPGGTYVKFDVVDACVRDIDRPIVNGIFWGGPDITVRYADKCVARLDVTNQDVICLACD